MAAALNGHQNVSKDGRRSSPREKEALLFGLRSNVITGDHWLIAVALTYRVAVVFQQEEAKIIIFRTFPSIGLPEHP